ELKKALDVNPSSLEAHALLAGLAYVEDKKEEFQSEIAKALAVSPKYGEVYRVAGDQASHNYRFEEAVDLVKRALDLDPDNPHARPRGEFRWEATLWHELAHVITIQMSNQRVPRWLTEGISVYEEKVARPEWARGQDMAFAQMLNANEAFKVKDLNGAFTNPR